MYRRPSRGNRTGPHPHPNRDLRKTLPRRSRQPAEQPHTRDSSPVTGRCPTSGPHAVPAIPDGSRVGHHEDVKHRELRVRAHWRQTGNPCFPVVARVKRHWWVLRVNNFPDHPVWTLLVDGERKFDLDEAPAAWGNPADSSLPSLAPEDAEEAISRVKAFTAYGSEVGQPCDNPFCCG